MKKNLRSSRRKEFSDRSKHSTSSRTPWVLRKIYKKKLSKNHKFRKERKKKWVVKKEGET